MATAIPLHERWRKQYRDYRYARHLSRPELNQRIRDIILNLMLLTGDAKLGVVAVDAVTGGWWEKWTHVLEEMVARYGPYPNGFAKDVLHTDPLPDFTCELADKAARRMSALGVRQDAAFIKFGRREFMESLHCEGRLRIQPASYFSTSGLNGAVRDDELNVPISVALSREDVLSLVVNPEDVPPDGPEQRVDIQFSYPSDYWLYCVSTSMQPRLFVDFNADACVIIRDAETFGQRLRRAAEQPTGRARLVAAKANYIDPLLPSKELPFVPLAKHFSYSYQGEHRFCWLPTSPQGRLSHLDVALGPLEDIAELVTLG